MVASTKDYPNLRPLEEEISQNAWDCRIYRVGSRVFGCGEARGTLAEKSFQPTEIYLHHEPAFCKRLLLEGFIDYLRGKGYREWLRKGRVTIYEPDPYARLPDGLQVYRGYDLRVIWWQQDDEIRFGIVVDVRWEVQDTNGKRLSPSEIAEYQVMRQFAQIQEELLPTGQINTEVARSRLQNHILPFVKEHSSFSLPCGGTATISPTPVRVILGG
ncbi:hypothetical protein DRJ19_03025 [Candidatus Woesearchaeota archaeon]|nr:MAG: hypothetical protein DRJ19_03025 [Candidatus Woesearchaeota archaeon]